MSARKPKRRPEPLDFLCRQAGILPGDPTPAVSSPQAIRIPPAAVPDPLPVFSHRYTRAKSRRRSGGSAPTTTLRHDDLSNGTGT
jgi:hypothetical protein